MATEVDFITYSDSDFNLTQAAGLTPGTNPLHMQIRTTATDPTVWVECTTANGFLTVSGSNVIIYIPQASLVTMPPGQYVYSVVMSSGNGTFRTLLFFGNITHNAGPTQWAAGTP